MTREEAAKLERARDVAIKIADANVKYSGFDGKPEVNYDRLVSDIMDALVEFDTSTDQS